jgi:hypothetical protein
MANTIKKTQLTEKRRIRAWIEKNSKWISPIPSMITMLAAVIGFGWHFASLEIDKQVNAKLDTPLKNITQLQTDLGRLQSRVETFIQLEQRRLEQLGDIKPTELGRQLPKATAVLQGAAELRVAPPSNFDHFQAVLRDATRTTPGFWPAAAALVDYQSSIQANLNTQTLGTCFTPAKLEHSFKGNIFTDGTALTSMPRYYEFLNCSLDLGDTTAFNQANLYGIDNPLRANQPIIFRMEGVRVIYHGGPIIPIQEIQCRNCTYEFNGGETPKPPTKRLIESLLYAELDNVNLDIPHGS